MTTLPKKATRRLIYDPTTSMTIIDTADGPCLVTRGDGVRGTGVSPLEPATSEAMVPTVTVAVDADLQPERED